MTDTESLARRLGLTDAIAIGLGSMIGAGVFVVFAPAAAAAGSAILVGLAIAAVVAYANATASAQLAAQYPTSGGTYVYGREQLGEWPGFFAGWSFVIGKTASCAVMGMTVAAYVAPAGWEKPAAVVTIVLVTAINYRGVTRTAAVTKVIVVVVISVLGLVVIAATASNTGNPVNLVSAVGGSDWYGVFQSAGLLFMAFAGYARIATLGEEVRSPQRTIPRAIVISLGVTLIIYGTIAIATLATLGPARLAESNAPLAEVASIGGWEWTEPLVRGGAAISALGALLVLIAGVGRTSLAMARNDDLPRWLSAVHPRFKIPHRAELSLAAIICVLVLLTDLRAAIGFSAFGVLLYYLVTNIAAYRQNAEHRRFPRLLQIAGAGGCVVLVATLPWQPIVGGIIILVVGTAYRATRLSVTNRRRVRKKH